METPAPHDPALLETPSDRNYTRAVILSALFGFVGAQHFYLGRTGEGMLDVALTAGWLIAFSTGHVVWGIGFLVLDALHAFATTILLLTGNQRDGRGHRVCYPGQPLRPTVIH